MVLINPGPLAHIKRSRPYSNLQSQSANATGKVPHATGKLRGIGRGILTASVSVTQVEMKVVITQVLQMLRQPLSIRERRALGDFRVEGRPAPPSKHVVRADATMMQLSNRGPVVLELRVVVFSRSKHHTLSCHRFARGKRDA